jgi:hypothetical protein
MHHILVTDDLGQEGIACSIKQPMCSTTWSNYRRARA